MGGKRDVRIKYGLKRVKSRLKGFIRGGINNLLVVRFWLFLRRNQISRNLATSCSSHSAKFVFVFDNRIILLHIRTHRERNIALRTSYAAGRCGTVIDSSTSSPLSESLKSPSSAFLSNFLANLFSVSSSST